jgi:cytohesin
MVALAWVLLAWLSSGCVEAAEADLGPELAAGAKRLVQAVREGNAEAVEMLLRAGADPDLLCDGHAAIHWAAWEAGREMTELLVEHGADVNLVADDGCTPLASAVAAGDAATAAFLARKGARLAEAGSLRDAAARGELSEVRKLIEQGASVDRPGAAGLTPLHCAVGAGHLDIAELLLSHGAPVDGQDAGGRTPLHLAASGGSRSLVGFLMAHGAALDVVNKWGYTPLMAAARRGRHAAASVLAEAGAELGRPAGADTTALHVAAYRSGRAKVVDALLAAGADPNVRNSAGRTPLHLAAAGGSVHAARRLLEAGARPVPDQRGITPLITAVTSTARVDILDVLKEGGADPNARDQWGQSPLHVAASGGHLAQVKWLIENGADPNLRDDSGKTPLQRAASRGYREVAEYLRHRGTTE